MNGTAHVLVRPATDRIHGRRALRRVPEVMIVVLLLLAGTPAGAVSFQPGLHTAAEVRAGWADESSRWRGADDEAGLLDAAATVRPLASATAGDFSFAAELELVAGVGDTLERAVFATPLLATPENELFDLSRTWSEGMRHRHTVRLDRLALTWQPSWGAVTAGRHAVTWGGGLVFNPFDLFNPFAPADVIRDFKRGADMLHIDVPLPDGGWQFLAVGRRDPLTGKAAADASSFAVLRQIQRGNHELSLLGAWHYDEPVLGMGMAGLLGEASWRIDGTWVRVRPPGFATTDDAVALVANLQYSWVWGGHNVFGFLEYHHHGFGHARYASALTDPFLLTQIARRNSFLLGRDYLAASLQLELHPLVNVFVSALVNVRDPSGLVQPRVVWNATARTQVTAGLDVPWGARGTEFGGIELGPESGGTRAPVSAYVRATWDW